MNSFWYTLKKYFPLCIFPVVCLFFIFFLNAAYADRASLNKQLQHILTNPCLNGVSCGIHIVSTRNNSTLFQFRNDDLFRVASNMKLLTTAAALEYLGPDFLYKTSVEINGEKTVNGVLEGNIIIRGSGDPNLSGRFHNGNILAVPESWLKVIQDMDIRAVTGEIIADDRVFDRVYVNPNWPKNQLSRWYCAPSSGLSFNDNCVDITILSGKQPDKTVNVFIEPKTSYFTIHNNCVYTLHKKEHAYSLFRKTGTNEISIKGKFWVNASSQKNWVTVHNPSLYLATVFKETLEEGGIAVSGDVRLIKDEDLVDNSFTNRKKIAQTTSSMAQTVTVTNKRSQNFYAEQILKTLGRHVKGRGCLEAGIEVMSDFMRKLGVPSEEYCIEDGSGLSMGNTLSPKMLTTLLSYMSTHVHKKYFFDSLPVSGVDGGLRRRIIGPRYKNKVHAKTGYIAKTSALSGYIETMNGDLLVFSVITNNIKNLSAVRMIEDSICKAIIDHYN
ncbi:MAG: D-alanyl-D-alanine carboxypeptidase/D-alanyl-D-alanine-endopeptidase [Candidatus Brocadiaceae bacterium]|nr:D-alanyl-D-alanine carboxypeptidase/D-alanyl-D-alanine-endopeptidase [Candidatus Brocadiaceae bacterium]